MPALLLGLLLAAAQQQPQQQQAQTASSVHMDKVPQPPAAVKPPVETAPESPLIRRVYIDKFQGGEGADLLREMVISSLQNSHLFIITEEQDNADAVLKGSAQTAAFRDLHITSESSHLAQRGSRSDSITQSGHWSTREATSSSNDTTGGDSRSSHIEERKHEASAAVRLVSKNGDVIWSTTQESLGAKFRGANADVAEKIARQLISDWQRVKRGRLDGE